MDKKDFSITMLNRTKKFAFDILDLCGKIPETTINRPLIAQLVKAGTSVGANYRATRRAKSKADFINKFKIVEEELDESLFFLELFHELCPAEQHQINTLTAEGEELLKIIVASLNKLRI